MPFDPVGCFVNAETFGINPSVAGVLNGLRVDDDQGCPFRFFLTCSRTSPCSTSLIASKIFSARHCLSCQKTVEYGGRSFGRSTQRAGPSGADLLKTVTAVLELVEEAVHDFAFRPDQGSGEFLVRHEWFEDVPLVVGEVAVVGHSGLRLFQNHSRYQMGSTFGLAPRNS